ncbi:MAG: DUF983 domain-containing protein [Rhodospirillaceae bacterium]|nr:DUF983 domain-containing protein [Rhodospirillaceae bacterium]
MTANNRPNASLAHVALKGRCPRCGEGALFRGYLKIAPACSVCGLKLEGHDTGDGPAFFVMLPLCLIVTGGMLGTELVFAPPVWVHILLWPTVILGVAGAALRPITALMVALQYRHRDVEHYDESAQQ